MLKTKRVVIITNWQTSKCQKEIGEGCFCKAKTGKCLKSEVRNVYCKYEPRKSR